MLLELHRIDGRRRDDELQVAAFGQQCGQIAEKEIDVQASFVRLVDHDGVVGAELRVALDLCQQNAVGNDPEPRGLGRIVGETHLIADLVAQSYSHFGGDAFGYGACGDTARLRVHDLAAMRASPELQQDLRQLRGLAGTRLAGNDDHLA